MKNTVQFLIGFEGDWQDLSFEDNGFTINITDFDQAIRIAKDSNIKNIRLRQDDKVNGGTIEWDNF
jgi:hypothetical protein